MSGPKVGTTWNRAMRSAVVLFGLLASSCGDERSAAPVSSPANPTAPVLSPTNRTALVSKAYDVSDLIRSDDEVSALVDSRAIGTSTGHLWAGARGLFAKTATALRDRLVRNSPYLRHDLRDPAASFTSDDAARRVTLIASDSAHKVLERALEGLRREIARFMNPREVGSEQK